MSLSSAAVQWIGLAVGAAAGTAAFIVITSCTTACFLGQSVSLAGATGLAEPKLGWSVPLAGPPGAMIGLALAEAFWRAIGKNDLEYCWHRGDW